jgi:hypothetical protein
MVVARPGCGVFTLGKGASAARNCWAGVVMAVSSQSELGASTGRGWAKTAVCCQESSGDGQTSPGRRSYREIPRERLGCGGW